MSHNIAIVSGEVSGDLTGSALVREMRAIRPDLHIWGIGSRHMADERVDLLFDSGSWGAIGYVEALQLFPALRFRVLPALFRAIASRKPDAVILIDFGAFNIRVARFCSARGVPVLYYFPPGSWKRSGQAGGELAQVTTAIATPFPWSADRLREAGAQVEFVGHPLLDIVRPPHTREEFSARFGLDVKNPVIGLLPGSRAFEVEHNSPAMLGAAQAIQRVLPAAQFVFAAASTMARERIERVVRDFQVRSSNPDRRVDGQSGAADRHGARSPEVRLVTPEGVVVPADHRPDSDFEARLRSQLNPLPVIVADGCAYDVIAHSDVLLTCAGTATLEAAILGTPMVIIYKGSRLMAIEYKLRRLNRIKHIGMPNIISDERIVPELIHLDANPERMATEALRLLTDPEARARTKSALREVRERLGKPGASLRVARMALEVAGIRPAQNSTGTDD